MREKYYTIYERETLYLHLQNYDIICFCYGALTIITFELNSHKSATWLMGGQFILFSDWSVEAPEAFN